ncbi:hypothetical protein LEP1GSC123_0137 [Leptospira borgpetersenii str. 200701203]|uniref:Uncharacterized protein n=1 Tax=Leptospira borgpetersenii str. 200701203 TaxID=1193007 RepID=M3HLV1_LEPBO|nr:hypothetical protein LEP1GSC123_0137 [Leptospira borgpetersenii str. 200701203]
MKTLKNSKESISQYFSIKLHLLPKYTNSMFQDIETISKTFRLLSKNYYITSKTIFEVI